MITHIIIHHITYVKKIITKLYHNCLHYDIIIQNYILVEGTPLCLTTTLKKTVSPKELTEFSSTKNTKKETAIDIMMMQGKVKPQIPIKSNSDENVIGSKIKEE